MKVRFVLGGCLVVCAASALAWAQPETQAPKSTNPPAPAATRPGALPTTAGVGESVDPNKYIIGPEDILAIQVWREPDFSKILAVRPDGKITLPLLGEIQAGGQTPIQLTKTVTDKLGNYVNRPDVTVIVEQVRSKRYYIDGEVTRPGEYTLVGPTRVLEALSKAGGFQEFANKKKIKILRNEGKQTFKFNYKEVSRGKHLEENIELENGDHIIVP